MRRLPPQKFSPLLNLHIRYAPPPPPPPPTQHQTRTFRQPRIGRNSTAATTTTPRSPVKIYRTATPDIARRQRPGTSNTILRFRITLAPPGVSRKVLELVKRASASKHLLRGTASIHSILSSLPSVARDVGPVVFALSDSGGSVVRHVPVILECNRLGIPWVYVPASPSSSSEGEGEGEDEGGGVVGRTGVGTVMVVPWVAGARASGGREEGDGVQVGEGAKAVSKEFNFRDARRVVVGLLARAKDLDCGGEEGGE